MKYQIKLTKILVLIIAIAFTSTSKESIGNLTSSQIAYIRSVITGAQSKYLPCYEFTDMAAQISERLGAKLGGNYWDVFIFPKPCQDASQYAASYQRKYYFSVNETSNNMCYITHRSNSTAPMQKWTPHSDLSQEQWGSGVNETQKNLIRNLIKKAYQTKGTSVWQNARFLFLNLTPGSWQVTIAKPTVKFGGFAKRSVFGQYAVLGNYGESKWIYIISRIF